MLVIFFLSETILIQPCPNEHECNCKKERKNKILFDQVKLVCRISICLRDEIQHKYETKNELYKKKRDI